MWTMCFVSACWLASCGIAAYRRQFFEAVWFWWLFVISVIMAAMYRERSIEAKWIVGGDNGVELEAKNHEQAKMIAGYIALIAAAKELGVYFHWEGRTARAEWSKEGRRPSWRIDEIIRDVAELPGRTSPGDWPEAMLVTGKELQRILEGYEPIEFCQSPCGHSSQYAYSENGGANIVCLLCERAHPQPDPRPPACPVCRELAEAIQSIEPYLSTQTELLDHAASNEDGRASGYDVASVKCRKALAQFFTAIPAAIPCAECGKPKEASRPNSIYCRACDHPERKEAVQQ
jgi:hypothetical protein